MRNTMILSILTVLAAASLAGCASPSDEQRDGMHHMGQSTNATPSGSSGPSSQGGSAAGTMAASQGGCGMMGAGTSGSGSDCGMMGDSKAGNPGAMPRTDKDAMCAMYRGMRDAPTEQARQAMMDRQMQGMSPEMRQRHMEMMRQQCQ